MDGLGRLLVYASDASDSDIHVVRGEGEGNVRDRNQPGKDGLLQQYPSLPPSPNVNGFLQQQLRQYTAICNDGLLRKKCARAAFRVHTLRYPGTGLNNNVGHTQVHTRDTRVHTRMQPEYIAC